MAENISLFYHSANRQILARAQSEPRIDIHPETAEARIQEVTGLDRDRRRLRAG
jgi:hypothetical protein